MSENQQMKDPLANGEAGIIKIECNIPESGGFEEAGKEIRLVRRLLQIVFDPPASEV